jgi:transglutaminase-like putative cysteine protease
MIYRVLHSTTYEYHETVSLSQHVLRVRPRDSPWQTCFDFHVSISPAPRTSDSHIDYFGNAVAFVGIEQPHTRLTIQATSRVRKNRLRFPDPLETASWEQTRELSRGPQMGAALEASEFLFDSPLIQSGDEYAHYAASSFIKGRPVLDAVLHLTGRISEDFTFEPGATTVSTPVENLLRNRRGVCQDFAHFQIACLRSIGLPARYVSGYIETLPPPGREKLRGSDASHAWVSFYSHGLGWIDVDPTNNLLASQQHVMVGWGRDYSDVSPVRGVILGSGQHSVKVAVDVERIDCAPATS